MNPPTHHPARRRLPWPLVVLLLSIGLTAYAAFDAQRAVRSQRALADRALHDYAGFAAWSYAQHLLVSLNSLEREAIGAVNHGDNMHINPQVPRARDLAHYLPWDPECACRRARAGPSPEAFFAVSLRHHTLDVATDLADERGMPMMGEAEMRTDMNMGMHASPPAPRTSREPRYSSAERRWLLDSLTQRVRNFGGIDRGFTLVVEQSNDSTWVFAYTLMPTAWGDTLVYGARYAKPSLASILGGVLDEPGLLPATFTEGRRNRDLVAVRVSDSTGHPLFSSAPDAGRAPVAHLDLPARFGSLRIDAMIRPEVAGSLLIGGQPTSRLPFLLGLLALAAALSIVAVAQLRREGELARLRADFVSSVSHELRTPLAQIRLYLETLRLGRAPSAEGRDWALGNIERETTRLSHLVEKVLRFSTLGQGEPGPAEPLDVGREVKSIVDEFSPLAAARHAAITFQADPVPPLRVRPDALRHVLINLLDNAVKYGPAGQSIRVAVSSAGGGAEITVEDQGPGIDPHEAETIWRPFSRGKTAVEQGGSGIGLTIVRDVTTALGGTVRLEPGTAGARFVVSLPAGGA